MKNIYKILITFCLITLSNKGYSQNFEYGIIFGLPVSCIGYSNRLNTHIMPDKPYIWMHYFQPKVGLNFSLVGLYNINEKLTIAIEPGYVLKGANFSSGSSKLDLHYINIPIILKYKTKNDYGFYIGSEFSKLLNAELDFNGTKNMDSFYNEKIETSILLGIDYRFAKHIELGVRCNYGLTKVSETNWMDESGMIYGTVKENNFYALFYTSIYL